MNRLVITGVSSMQAWDEGALEYSRPSRIVSPSSFARTAKELRGFTTLPAGCTYPVDILVGDRGSRIRSKRWSAHLRSGLLTSGTLSDLGEGRYLTSPEFFYLNTAPKLSVVQAVLLGMELCGYYSTLMSVPYREYCDELIRNRVIGVGDRPWPPAAAGVSPPIHDDACCHTGAGGNR